MIVHKYDITFLSFCFFFVIWKDSQFYLHAQPVSASVSFIEESYFDLCRPNNFPPIHHALTLVIIVSSRPAIFKSGAADDSNEKLHGNTSQPEIERDSSDDDGLPPLEANTNRLRPFELQMEEDSESNSDTDDRTI